MSAISSERETSTWTSRSPRSAAKAESTARSDEPRQRTSCHGRRRRWAARGRKASEWRSTAAADSILPSANRLNPTCSMEATPARESCSKALSSIQFRVTTKGMGDVGLWWAIDLAPLPLPLVVVVIDIFSAVLAATATAAFKCF